MEDVNFQRAKCRFLIVAISIILFASSIQSYAASQGVLGTASTGSVSITVTIPETVRLFANQVVSDPQSNESFACIYVSDRGVAKDSLHFYRVKQQGVDHSEHLHMLKNHLALKSLKSGECNHSDSLIKLKSMDSFSTNTSVLMLVPE